jgi:hypothetical protein
MSEEVMTDEELLEMLRNNVGVSEAACRAAREAANRIEALVKERDDAKEADLGRKVIVRSHYAGVLYGEYAGNDGSTVHLKNARQLWKWCAVKGITLIDVATYGVKKRECKFSSAQATVTVFNACALIDVTADASSSIEAV